VVPVAVGRHAVVVARVLLVLALVVVVVGSVVPSEDVPGAGRVSDKVMHLLGYAVLGALAAASLQPRRPVLAGLLLLGFGLALELVQRQLGYRSFEWADLASDALGIALGVLLVLVVDALLRRRA